jgi:hypothetical protein
MLVEGKGRSVEKLEAKAREAQAYETHLVTPNTDKPIAESI